MFAISTTAIINKKGYVVGITDSREGSCHDMTIFRENIPDFGVWLKKCRAVTPPKRNEFKLLG